MRNSLTLALLLLISVALVADVSGELDEAASLLTTDPEAAETAYRSLLTRYPYHDSAWSGLVEALLAQSQPEAALAVAQDGLQQLGEHPGLLRLAAWSAFQSNRYLLSLQLYKRRIEVAGPTATDLAGQGWNLVKLGSWHTAQQEFLHAARLDSASVAAQSGLAATASPWRLLHLKLGYAAIEGEGTENPSASALLHWGDWKAYIYGERFSSDDNRDVLALGVSPAWGDWRLWLEWYYAAGDNRYVFPGRVYSLHLWHTLYMGAGALDSGVGGSGSDWAYHQTLQMDASLAWNMDRWNVGAQAFWLDVRYHLIHEEDDNDYPFSFKLDEDCDGWYLRLHGEAAVWNDIIWLGVATEWGERGYLVHPGGYLVDNSEAAHRVLVARARLAWQSWHLLAGAKYDNNDNTLWFIETGRTIRL
ncbi:MAG: hypothetical protein K8R90_08425 [Candidatus Cloacimonetes bacterium]|nr:hypothetical protein [Candidatus Cloacimonadota bacterium]